MTTTHDDKAREREQFEAWALNEGDFSRTQLSLNTPMAQVAWDAWVSRAALSPASTGQEAILCNGLPVEITQMDWVCHYLKTETVFDGDDILQAWNKLVEFYVANRAAPAQQVEAEIRDETKLAIDLARIAHQYAEGGKMRHDVGLALLEVVQKHLSAAGSNNGEKG